MTDSNRNGHGTTSSMCAELRGLAVDAPDDGFSAALHRRLVAEPVPGPAGLGERVSTWLRDRRFWLWPATGIASGLAVYALLVVLHGNPTGMKPGAAAVSQPAVATDTILPSFRIPSSKVAVIKLAFTAEVAVEDVTFQVTLPEGLHFWSGGQRLAERTFRWPGRLEAGENLIPIAVRGDEPGRYPVVATVEVGGRVLEQTVVMDVQKERS